MAHKGEAQVQTRRIRRARSADDLMPEESKPSKYSQGGCGVTILKRGWELWTIGT